MFSLLTRAIIMEEVVSTAVRSWEAVIKVVVGVKCRAPIGDLIHDVNRIKKTKLFKKLHVYKTN